MGAKSKNRGKSFVCATIKGFGGVTDFSNEAHKALFIFLGRIRLSLAQK